jgi:hypothetical protein
MSRLAIIVRASVAVTVTVSALFGVAAPARVYWVVGAVVVLDVWTGCYVWLTWSRGLLGWVIAVDLVMATALGLASGVLMAAPIIVVGWGWVTNISSMVVVCAQLAGHPGRSLPGSMVVVAAAGAGLAMAGASTGTVTNVVVTVAIQAAVSAGVMALSLRTARGASRAVAELERAEGAAQIARARREDELAQLRLLHNGPVTTLSMAMDRPGPSASVLIRQRAGMDLQLLPELGGVNDDAPGPVERLDDRLGQVVGWYGIVLTVTAALPPYQVPRAVAAAFADGVSEALENVYRHSGVSAAEIDLTSADGNVQVVVRDQGRGFEPGSRHGFGIREVIVAGMRTVGGDVDLMSAPGRGVTVSMRWSPG